MDDLETQNSDGRILKNSFWGTLRCFFSPKQFWMVYAYWISVTYYASFSTFSLMRTDGISWLCPFAWGCKDFIDFTIPIFFLILCFSVVLSGYKKKYFHLRSGIVHIVLIIALTNIVTNILGFLFWAF